MPSKNLQYVHGLHSVRIQFIPLELNAFQNLNSNFSAFILVPIKHLCSQTGQLIDKSIPAVQILAYAILDIWNAFHYCTSSPLPPPATPSRAKGLIMTGNVKKKDWVFTAYPHSHCLWNLPAKIKSSVSQCDDVTETGF